MTRKNIHPHLQVSVVIIKIYELYVSIFEWKDLFHSSNTLQHYRHRKLFHFARTTHFVYSWILYLSNTVTFEFCNSFCNISFISQCLTTWVCDLLDKQILLKIFSMWCYTKIDSSQNISDLQLHQNRFTVSEWSTTSTNSVLISSLCII